MEETDNPTPRQDILKTAHFKDSVRGRLGLRPLVPVITAATTLQMENAISRTIILTLSALMESVYLGGEIALCFRTRGLRVRCADNPDGYREAFRELLTDNTEKDPAVVYIISDFRRALGDILD